MALSKRLEKLEAQRGEIDGPRVIIRRILWQDSQESVGFVGRALTPTGWRTVSAGADTSEEEFERRLWRMAEEKCTSHT